MHVTICHHRFSKIVVYILTSPPRNEDYSMELIKQNFFPILALIMFLNNIFVKHGVLPK